MNTVTAVPTATQEQIKANVARWRREHGLEPKPQATLAKGRIRFTHPGDRMAQIGREK